MKLYIDDRVFEGMFIGMFSSPIPDVRIDLTNESDVLFFQSWVDKRRNSLYKKEHVKNIKFSQITREGTLFNCEAFMSMNEDFGLIKFDYYKENRP